MFEENIPKLLFVLNNVKHFDNGKFTHEEENWGIQGDIYEFEGITSAQFNQLKGKLYNLVESSVIDEKQRNAMKGLVKDFCNEKYRNTIGDLKDWVKRMGFKIEDYPEGKEPLENN